MDEDNPSETETTSAATRPIRHRLVSKKLGGRKHGKTQVNIGDALERWRHFKEQKNFETDAEVAHFLLDSYLQTASDDRSHRPSLEMGSSTETCESVHREYPFVMSSSNEAEQEQVKKDQIPNGVVREEEEEEEEEEEFCTSLSVGDGRYLVDLGSPSEFIVDEECILQLMKSCRECSKQCTVRKQVKGLKLVVYQACCFCQSRSKWTNLPDDDDEEQF